MGNPIRLLLEIYCCLQQWKNFANRSRIDKVIAMARVAPFFDSRCIKTVSGKVVAHSIAFRVVSIIQYIGRGTTPSPWNLLCYMLWNGYNSVSFVLGKTKWHTAASVLVTHPGNSMEYLCVYSMKTWKALERRINTTELVTISNKTVNNNKKVAWVASCEMHVAPLYRSVCSAHSGSAYHLQLRPSAPA